MNNLTQAYLNVSVKLPSSKDVTDRLNRGFDIISGFGYRVVPQDNGLYAVIKASTSMLDTTETFYLVSKDTCTCPDYDKARAGLCKHRLAIMILLEKERLDNDNRNS